MLTKLRFALEIDFVLEIESNHHNDSYHLYDSENYKYFR